MTNSLERSFSLRFRIPIWIPGALLLSCAGDAKDLGSTQLDVNTVREQPQNQTESDAGSPATDSPSPSSSIFPSSPLPTPTSSTLSPTPTPTSLSQSPTPTPLSPTPSLSPDVGPPDALLECTAALDAAWQWRNALVPGVPDGPLVGIWQGEAQVSDLGLPSGSKKVTLTLAEDHASVTFGEVADESPLLNQTASASSAIREGFEYTLLASEVLFDETDPDGDPFAQAVRLSVFPFEPYDDLCQEQEPSAPSGDRCRYSCLPSELTGYETISEQDGECFVDGTPLSCDRVALCTSACYCDESGCLGDPLEALEMMAGLQPEVSGWFMLSLPPAWTALNNAPTLGANGQVWVQLLHAEPPSGLGPFTAP